MCVCVWTTLPAIADVSHSPELAAAFDYMFILICNYDVSTHTHTRARIAASVQPNVLS